jgi:hypothetical protein
LIWFCIVPIRLGACEAPSFMLSTRYVWLSCRHWCSAFGFFSSYVNHRPWRATKIFIFVHTAWLIGLSAAICRDTPLFPYRKVARCVEYCLWYLLTCISNTHQFGVCIVSWIRKLCPQRSSDPCVSLVDQGSCRGLCEFPFVFSLLDLRWAFLYNY